MRGNTNSAHKRTTVALRSLGSRFVGKPLHAVRMIRRRETTEDANARTSLQKALRSGVTAMGDAEIEARVVDYFLKNPNYRCDTVHVAAVACRFQVEKESLPTPSARTKPVSLQL